MELDVRPLLDEAFAPSTSSLGFLELPLDEAVAGLVAWRSERHAGIEVEYLAGSLESMLPRLAPLTGGVRPRELLVSCGRGQWVAYFDCSLRGTNAVSTVGHLSSSLHCQGVAIRYVPDLSASEGRRGRLGSIQFELFGPLQTDFANYVRTISVSNDGRRWRFDTGGTVQWFEEVTRYKSSRVRSRFDAVMLRDYCRALGLDPFDSPWFGPQGALVTTPLQPALGGHVMTFAEAQEWLGIHPSC